MRKIRNFHLPLIEIQKRPPQYTTTSKAGINTILALAPHTVMPKAAPV